MAATTVSSLRAVSLKAEKADISSKSTVSSIRVAKVAKASSKAAAVCQIEDQETVSRRATLSLFAVAAAAAASSPSPAFAAYGDKANVFGKATPDSGYRAYKGDGFTVAIPSKWNPSKEIDFPGTILRYEDNFDAVSNVIVTKNPATKNSIEDYGSPEQFLQQIQFYLGTQVFAGETKSEGGFAPGRVARANLLDVQKIKDKSGTTYYVYEILTTTADGDEGGRHQLIKAAVKNGSLFVAKWQAGDKRWFKGTERVIRGALESFSV